jgi:hypothetical protein
MGRKIISVMVIALLIMAFFTFFNVRENWLSPEKDFDADHPRLILENFVLQKFVGETVRMRLTGKQGRFLSSNAIEIVSPSINEFDGTRQWRRIKADHGKAFFENASILELSADHLTTIYFDGNVEAKTLEYTLGTERCVYDVQKQVLTSISPSKVNSSDSRIESDRGFRLTMVDEVLEMYGDVSGEIDAKDL